MGVPLHYNWHEGVHKRVVDACIMEQAGKAAHRERFALNSRTRRRFATAFVMRLRDSSDKQDPAWSSSSTGPESSSVNVRTAPSGRTLISIGRCTAERNRRGECLPAGGEQAILWVHPS